MKSNKLGVLTLHYGFNEGAVLQAYALSKLVEKNFPSDEIEILDHRYPAKVDTYGSADTGRKKALKKAIDHWLPLSEQQFLSERKEPSFCYAAKTYDKLFVGSDVVWALCYKTRFRRFFKGGLFPRQTEPFFAPFPNVYWPGKSVNAQRIAYAASIGSTEYDLIPKSHLKQMYEILDGFSAIGVRDERTLRFIERISNKLVERAQLVPDPTLSIDFIDDSIEAGLRERLADMGVDFSRPRCVVISDDNRVTRAAVEELKKKGYQIVGVTTKNTLCDLDLSEAGFHPMEWAMLFRFFDLCISERMHGAIFALKNKTPLLGLDMNETSFDNDSKIVSLMKRFELGDFVQSKDDRCVANVIAKLEGLIELSPRWGSLVQRPCEAALNQAADFMRKICL